MLLYGLSGYGQLPTPTLVFSLPVNPNTGNDQTEPSIAINKIAPNNLVLSSNVMFPGTGYTQTLYISNNGGQNWVGADHMPNSYSAAGEPSVAYDASGNAYLTGIDAGGQPFDRYNLEVSTDNGASWGPQQGGPLTYTSSFDRPMSTADDMPTSPFVNNYYCVWKDQHNSPGRIVFNTSPDQGASFIQESALSISSDAGVEGADIKTGSNGEIYVCWSDYPYSTTYGDYDIPASSIGFAYSTNGGASFNKLGPIMPVNGIAYHLWDHGDPRYNNTTINDWPSLAVDKSCGLYRGRIYMTVPTNVSAEGYNAQTLVYSCVPDLVTGTFNWTTSGIPINVNPAQNCWFPRVAVDDETGIVSVVYYSEDPTTFETDTWLAYSADGGNTWGNIKLSTSQHIPTRLLASGYAGLRLGITAFGGSTYASWMDNTTQGPNSQTLDGKWHVWVAKVNMGGPVPTVSTSTNFTINEPPILPSPQIYQAAQYIEVSTTNHIEVAANSNVEMKAGQYITIYPGTSANPQFFLADYGSVFLAHIEPGMDACTTPGVPVEKRLTAGNNFATDVNNIVSSSALSVYAYPDPASSSITIGLNKSISGVAYLEIYDATGNNIYQSNINNNQSKQIVNTSGFCDGIYCFLINAEGQHYSGKFIIAKN